MPITIKRVHSFWQAKRDWMAVEAQNHSLSPYAELRFQRLFVRCERPKLILQRSRLEIILFYRNSTPIGCLPLKKIGNIYYFLADRTIVGELDGVFSPDIDEATFAECMEELKKALKGADLVLNKLSENSRLYNYFHTSASSQESVVCVNIPFSDEYEEYYGALTKSVRQNIHTSYNRLNTDGMKYEFSVFAAEHISAALSDELYAVHLNRCVDKGYGGKEEYTGLRGFIRKERQQIKKHFDIVERGTARLSNNFVSVVRIDSKVASYVIGLVN